ncbi:hypothetical protein OZ429_05990 [Xanthomonas fragariae]|nr:hypothetical protein [Xanthomonas fragariae]WAT15898.1 hypothetical protein OZ429_05990 [Xanthomonas fragariae]
MSAIAIWERDAQRCGATRAPLLYRCMLAPGAMLANTVAVMLPILHRSMKLGML